MKGVSEVGDVLDAWRVHFDLIGRIRTWGLGLRGLGFRGLGCKGFGVLGAWALRVLGFRV